MAFTTTIGDTKITLIDNTPGIADNYSLRADKDGNTLTSAQYHNVTIPAVPEGTKITLKDPTNGWATFIYKKVGSALTAHAVAAGILLGDEVVSGVFTGDISNDNTTGSTKVVSGGAAYLALGAVTVGNYAFFQVGGRPAISLVSALDSDTLCATTGNVVAGGMALNAYDQACGFDKQAVGEAVVGIASTTDA